MIRYIISQETNPYENTALEEYLLLHAEPGEVILYLWQNERTVVIGRNQNPWRECRLEQLEADGGHLARRLSGGGAVFHDLGNLNFTFLAQKDWYDVERQTRVILEAVKSLGIPAEKNGRNDLMADGRKFSGNAFYQTGKFCYHHGTILIQASQEDMARYLQVSEQKLRSKGVASVKSRVGNLTRLCPGLTVEAMKKALVAAFEQVYGEQALYLPPERIPAEEKKAAAARFGSWEWLYGRRIPFNFETSGRFDWGEVWLCLNISGGVILDAECWTDALDAAFSERVCQALSGCRFRKQEMREALESRGINEAAELLRLLTEEEKTNGNI